MGGTVSGQEIALPAHTRQGVVELPQVSVRTGIHHGADTPLRCDYALVKNQ